MNKVRIGASTIAVWLGAAVAGIGAVVTALGTSAPSWLTAVLASLSAVLLVVNNVLRSWQAIFGDDTSGPADGEVVFTSDPQVEAP